MKKVIIIALIGIVITLYIGVYQSFTFADGKLHVIFCTVGQGDSIFIKTPSGQKILFDGGPDDSVLNCLSKYLPFWDKTLDLVLLSHPHQDHLAGLIPVLSTYTVKSFATENLANITTDYKNLIATIQNRGIFKRFLYEGDTYTSADGIVIKMLAPSQEFLHDTSPHAFIGERAEFASLIPYISYHSFHFLLTGDSQSPELLDALVQNSIMNVTLMQVPHHGSKTGLSQDILTVIHPKVAVISVGLNNIYHFPTAQAIDLLQKNTIPYYRTDQNGNVEIISDGNSFWVKTDK